MAKVTLTPDPLDGIPRFTAADMELAEPPSIVDRVIRDWTVKEKRAEQSEILTGIDDDGPQGILGEVE